MADASILCTVLGGDHYKNHLHTQIVDAIKFVIIPPGNSTTDFA